MRHIRKKGTVVLSAVLVATVLAGSSANTPRFAPDGLVGAQQAVENTPLALLVEKDTSLKAIASADGSVLATVPGESVLVSKSTVGDWYKVQFEEFQGYVFADAVTILGCAGLQLTEEQEQPKENRISPKVIDDNMGETLTGTNSVVHEKQPVEDMAPNTRDFLVSLERVAGKNDLIDALTSITPEVTPVPQTQELPTTKQPAKSEAVKPAETQPANSPEKEAVKEPETLPEETTPPAQVNPEKEPDNAVPEKEEVPTVEEKPVEQPVEQPAEQPEEELEQPDRTFTAEEREEVGNILRHFRFWTTEDVTAHVEPSLDSPVSFSIPKDASVIASRKAENWFKVSYEGKNGWIEKKFRSSTDPNATQVPSEPTPEEPEPIDPPEEPTPVEPEEPTDPAPEEPSLMTRPEAEAHLGVHLTKTNANTLELAYGTTGWSSIVVGFETSSDTKASLAMNLVSYLSALEIQPEDFGEDVYKSTKEHLAKMEDSALRYGETQFGKGTADAHTFANTFLSFAKTAGNGATKTVTISGKSVVLKADGSMASASY